MINGACFFRLNTDKGEITDLHHRKFDFEVLMKYEGPGKSGNARAARATGNFKRPSDIYSFSLKKLILPSEGSMVLVGEK